MTVHCILFSLNDQVYFKENKLKTVCYIFSYFISHTILTLFIPLCRSEFLSHINFLQPEELPLNISCSASFLQLDYFRLCLSAVHFIFIFEGYFYVIQNFKMTGFFFWFSFSSLNIYSLTASTVSGEKSTIILNSVPLWVPECAVG